MAKITLFPTTFENRVRKLAAELHPRSPAVRMREVTRSACRLAEEIRAAGAERWQAVKLEGHFKRCVLIRLTELDGQRRDHVAPVLAIAGGFRS